MEKKQTATKATKATPKKSATKATKATPKKSATKATKATPKKSETSEPVVKKTVAKTKSKSSTRK
ncbi:MAG: hypothetical protein AB7U98_00975 [Candidatus Nitrosocosmicus sp.]|nr:hypothetical protein [Candidatus Nitrosocosmicus sp.]